MTTDDAIAFALTLPKAEAGSHFDQVDVRVGKKIFASVPGPGRITVHVDPEHARVLIAADPETFIPHSRVWADRGWIVVDMAKVEQDLLEDLIRESWARKAPKRLQSDLDT
jgi:predicted DNA-binding protein (MmcQ/YjbR family)